MTVALRIDPDRLRESRVRLALTQRALADRAGVLHTTVSDLERGKRPARLPTIRKLADALGVAPDAIATVVNGAENNGR